ncbi:MAG TPA: biotin/lipoyl-binding protein [Acidimicrobiales bacterium]|nr:biotin/lipoyl-binding protein [Acidimicrobiales bacterium]
MRVPSWRWLRNKRVMAALAVVLAAGAGVGSWLATSSSAAPTTTTTIVTAAYGTVEQTASATGTIEPISQADVDFAVAGQVTAVDVSVGQTVTVGQTLATIDPTALEADLDSAQATLDADKSKLSSDTSDGAPSQELTADQAAVTAAQSAVTSAQDSLDDATLTAPLAGEVAEVNLAIGQQVSATGGGNTSDNTGNTGSSSSSFGASGASSSSSGSGGSSSSSQIVIVDTSSWLVDASVDDSSIGEIQQGDQANIVPEGSETTVYGTVGSIGLIATSSSGVASFPVTVDVTGNPSGLYTGMTADLTIVVKELSDVLTVPTAALRYENGGTYVELVQNGKDVLQPVTVGTSSGGESQITSGLAAGDQVVETFVRSTSTGASGTGSGFRFGGGLGGFGGSGLGGFGGG